MNDGYFDDKYDTSQWFLSTTDKGQKRDKKDWVYYPRNDDNMKSTTGAIFHLSHPSNNLNSEIDIAAQATVIRKNAKHDPITDSNELISCSQYGNINRNSDPFIGFTVNQLALAGHSISVSDPVAIYINDFDTSMFMMDVSGNRNGSRLKPVPEGWFKLVRGKMDNPDKPMGLRYRIRNPDDKDKEKNWTIDKKRALTVNDIYDIAQLTNIIYASHFAQYFTMGVAGVVTKGTRAPSQPCWIPLKDRPKKPGPSPEAADSIQLKTLGQARTT